MNQEKIGKFIMSSRKNKKLTQAELAEKLGVSDKTIGNWENGRNMPDLSLFKPLCEELDISVNELLAGEKLKREDLEKKSEENIINTINYSNKRIAKKNNFIYMTILIFGLLVSLIAFSIFKSESSWGSIYGVIGIIISLVGFGNIIKKYHYAKRLLLNLLYFICVLSIFIFMDYLNVRTNNTPPRFSYLKEYNGDYTVYKAPLYNVYRINTDTKNEYYIFDTKGKYNEETIPLSPFNRNICGIDNIIKLKNTYLNEKLISVLPLSEYNFTYNIDNENLELTINYYVSTRHFKDYYFEKSMIYDSVSIFLLTEKLEKIKYIFDDKSYSISRNDIKELYPYYKYIDGKEINKKNFNEYLENQLYYDDFSMNIFKSIFVDNSLKTTTKILVKNEEVIKNKITNKKTINEIINILTNSTIIRKGSLINDDGTSLIVEFYNGNGLIDKYYVFMGGSFGTYTKEYKMDSKEFDNFKKLINK